ncbi:MAG: hypothetical protein ACK5K7_02370 [Bacilli bacterium]
MLVVFSVGNNTLSISKSLIDKNLSSSTEVREIVNGYKFEETETGYVVNSESGGVEITRYSNSALYEEIAMSSPVEYAYELDAETEMLKIKEEFKKSVIDMLGEIELIIEYQSRTYQASGTRYLRGIRTNGAEYAYPSGTPSNLATGAVMSRIM